MPHLPNHIIMTESHIPKISRILYHIQHIPTYSNISHLPHSSEDRFGHSIDWFFREKIQETPMIFGKSGWCPVRFPFN